MEKAPKWPELNRSRACLEDLVDATAGRTLNQKKWLSQVEKFFGPRPSHKITSKDILRAAFRSRAMLRHLGDAKREIKAPPARFRQLNSLVQSMVACRDAPIASRGPSPAESEEVVEVPIVAQPVALLDVVGSSQESDWSFRLYDNAHDADIADTAAPSVLVCSDDSRPPASGSQSTQK